MRLIDKDALMEELIAIQSATYMSTCLSKDECQGKRWMIARAIDAIKDAQEVTAVPVVRGRWIEKVEQAKQLPQGYSLRDVRCSVCGETPRFHVKTNYCPNCGAKMEDKP